MLNDLSNKTINEWLEEYIKIVKSYSITSKTISNRMSSIKWIQAKLGYKIIGSIKPYEIAIEIKLEHKVYPTKAKRLLIEVKNLFTEAIIYGWIHTSPAIYLKALPAPVQRERLTLEEFSILYEYSLLHSQKWVPIMLLLALLTGQRRSDINKLNFTDIENGLLYIKQAKTGTKLAIPIKIKLNILNISLEEVIHRAKDYYTTGPTMIRKHNGTSLSLATLSATFHELVKAVGITKNVTLHECRSLSERLYREQGIDTRLLLGHKHQSMTDMYNDSRGLNKDTYIIVPI